MWRRCTSNRLDKQDSTSVSLWSSGCSHWTKCHVLWSEMREALFLIRSWSSAVQQDEKSTRSQALYSSKWLCSALNLHQRMGQLFEPAARWNRLLWLCIQTKSNPSVRQWVNLDLISLLSLNCVSGLAVGSPWPGLSWTVCHLWPKIESFHCL